MSMNHNAIVCMFRNSRYFRCVPGASRSIVVLRLMLQKTEGKPSSRVWEGWFKYSKYPTVELLVGFTVLIYITVDGSEVLHQVVVGSLSHNLRVFYIPGGAGFLPSTVVIYYQFLPLWIQQKQERRFVIRPTGSSTNICPCNLYATLDRHWQIVATSVDQNPKKVV